MDDKVSFALSYETLVQTAEEEILNCNLDINGIEYRFEMTKASAVLGYWNTLALRGNEGYQLYERIETDWKRLHNLIYDRTPEPRHG